MSGKLAPSRLLLLVGAVVFAVTSFLPWYAFDGRSENAWQGELSLAAGIAMVAAVALWLVGRGRAPRALWALLELAGSVAVAACTFLYIGENSDDIVVRGQIIPSGMQKTPYAALAAGILMSLGSLIHVFEKKAPRA